MVGQNLNPFIEMAKERYHPFMETVESCSDDKS
jgi:hypothetical protein